MDGQPKGYSSWVCRQDNRGYFWPLKAIYRVQIDLDNPLTYYSEMLRAYTRPDLTYESDQGSVPVTFQRFLPKDRRLVDFLQHDSGYTHGGLWISKDDNEYAFYRLPKQIVDDLLYESVQVSPYPVNRVVARIIHESVAIGGRNYGQGDLRKR